MLLKKKYCSICKKEFTEKDIISEDKNGNIVHFKCIMNTIGKGMKQLGIGFGDK